MGDLVLITPILRALSLQLGAKVDLLTKRTYKELFVSNPYVRDIHFNEEVKYSTLRSVNYNYIIDLQNSLRSLWARIVLNQHSLVVKKYRWRYLAYFKFGMKHMLPKKQMIQRYFDTAKRLDIVDDHRGLDIYPQDLIFNLDMEKSVTYVAVVMGGTYLTKRVPLNLIEGLPMLDNCKYILLGGADVKVDKTKLSLRSDMIDCINMLSISETISVISRTEVVLSGDTGMMHVAAALRKKLLVIWGSTSPEMGFSPHYPHQHRNKYQAIQHETLSCRPCSKYGVDSCPKGHMNCLTDLRQSQLNNQLIQML
jgi:ADP-heptose:LPS heptosyltransferase